MIIRTVMSKRGCCFVLGWFFTVSGPTSLMFPEGLSGRSAGLMASAKNHATVLRGPYLTETVCEQIAEQARDEYDQRGIAVTVGKCQERK